MSSCEELPEFQEDKDYPIILGDSILKNDEASKKQFLVLTQDFVPLSANIEKDIQLSDLNIKDDNKIKINYENKAGPDKPRIQCVGEVLKKDDQFILLFDRQKQCVILERLDYNIKNIKRAL